MRKLLFLITLLFVASPLYAQGGHEYAPLQEKAVNYKDWTLPGLNDRKLVNLRAWAKDKKLIMVVYFAPWCGNWRLNAPVVARLYEKYKAQGLSVVAVSEYGSLDETRAFFGGTELPYPVVSESETRDDKAMTAHYRYRKLTGDGRNWGSPWHIFLEPSKFPSDGDVLAANATVVNGELIEAEADKFIAGKLSAAKTATLLPAAQKEQPAFFVAAPDALNLKAKDDKDKAVKPCSDN